MKKNVLLTISFGIVLIILSLPSCRKDENVGPFVPSEPDVHFHQQLQNML